MEENTKKNTLWNTIGLTFNSFNSLFFLLIVRWINGLSISGIFSYAFSLCSLFYIVSTYFSRTYQIANYDGNKNLSQFFTTRSLFSVLSLVIIFLFSVLSGFTAEKISIIIFIMLFRTIEALSDCLFGYIQEHGLLYKVGISYTIKALTGLFVFFIIDLITKNINIALVGLVVINIIVMMLYDMKNVHILSSGEKIRTDFSRVKMILKEAFPIFAFSFLSIYMSNAQKYVMTYFISNELQSIFGILIMPATMLGLVGAYLIMPFITRLNSLYKEEKLKDFFRVSMKILAALFIVGLLALIVCFFIGIPVLNILYNYDLSKYRMGLEIIILGSIMAAATMIMSNILTIIKSNVSQLVIYLFSSLISTGLSMIFTKAFGLDGAIWAYFISYTVCFVTFFAFFVYRLKHPNYTL